MKNGVYKKEWLVLIIIDHLNEVIKIVKESPGASLVFTLLAGGIVILFKKSDVVLAANEKSAKEELKEQVTKLSILESFLALFLLDQSTGNRDKLFEKSGEISIHLSDKMKDKLGFLYLNPEKDEVKRFLIDLQEEIASLRIHVVRNEHLNDTQSIPGRAVMLARSFGRTVGTILLVIFSAFIVASVFGLIFTELRDATTLFRKINILLSGATALLAMGTFYIAGTTRLSKLKFPAAMMSMLFSMFIVGGLLLLNDVAILFFIIEIVLVRWLMRSINWSR
jgi:hypothetical protein